MVAKKMSSMRDNYTSMTDGRYYDEWTMHVMKYACEWCNLSRPPICNGQGQLCSEMARHVDLQSRNKVRRLCKEFQNYSTTTSIETYIIHLATLHSPALPVFPTVR